MPFIPNLNFLIFSTLCETSGAGLWSKRHPREYTHFSDKASTPIKENSIFRKTADCVVGTRGRRINCVSKDFCCSNIDEKESLDYYLWYCSALSGIRYCFLLNLFFDWIEHLESGRNVLRNVTTVQLANIRLIRVP